MNKKLKNFLKATEIAIGTGMFLMNQADRMAPKVRARMSDSFDDIRGRAKDAYDAITDRVSDLSFRRNDHSGVWNAVRFAAGLGIGVGIGMLLAPEPGHHTRSRISEKAQEFGDNMRHRFSSREDLRATGTGD